ncbi:tetratricopeptide repeat-containing glycosyltransferase family protein [Herbaspirillum sp.]|uniref:tetratricopeptide repeat-containing glycosyltransferase family protein n=1 Tax=Herbaspirillum sp. TaxID=1890675 RepID=UPI001B07DF9A|nr:tetratricopeptide repeat-containing glycosyltransferase family protein [Herbaspirillum sp.]MBO9535672.1 glycosyltransferase family protein [Herbaspirillum sp.]
MNILDEARLGQLMSLMCEAIALGGAGRHGPALEKVAAGLALEPEFFPLLMQRGRLQEQAGDFQAAVASYEECLALSPTLADAATARTQALYALVEKCDRALAGPLTAAVSEISAAKAHALFKLGLHEHALEALAPAMAAMPDDFSLLNLRADILLRLNRHEEALACYGQASGDMALLQFNRGNVLRQMGRFGEAQTCYEQALSLHPAFAEARVARSHLLLMAGHYEEGWREHEARRAIAQIRRADVHSASPQWQPGMALAGKTLLLWAEQGLGDSLQFARYIPDAAGRAGRTIVCAPPGLLPLLQRSFPMCGFIGNDKALPPHDLHAPLLSLPLLLGRPDPGQSPRPPYLVPAPARVADWAARLGERRRARIGITWAGRQYGAINHTRDLALAQLKPLFDVDADFISLQQAVPPADRPCADAQPNLQRFALNDWDDTAALMGNLDLVICIDSAVAHLAGALDMPVALMLRLEGEWRWGQQPERSAWYPRMRLFRQRQRGNWESVVEEVAAFIRTLGK